VRESRTRQQDRSDAKQGSNRFFHAHPHATLISK